jgi:hypothetical protein
VVALRALEPEARHTHADDVRAERAQALVVEAEVRHDACAEVVDDEVGADGEAPRQVLPARVVQVDHDAPLAAHERAREAAAAVAEVGAAAVLDPDHVGAEVGEDARRDGAGDDPGEVEDADAVERAAGTRRRDRCGGARRERFAVVLAQERRPPGAPGRVGEHERRPRVAHGAPDLGVLDRHEEPALGELRVLEQRLGRAHGGVRDAPELRALGDLRHRVARHPRIERVEDALGRGLPVRDLLERRVVDPGGEAVGLHPLQQRRPVAERAVHHPAVAAAGDAEVARPVERAVAGVHATVLVEEAGHLLERARGGGLEAHVDVLAAAGVLAGVERRECAGGGEDAGLVVGLEAERAQRRPVLVPVHVEHAAHRLGDGVGRAPVAVGARLSEGRDPGDDEAGVPGAECLGAEPERGERARRLRLDQHVGARGERGEPLGLPAPVEDQAPLAQVVEPEEQAPLRVRHAVHEGRDSPRRVAARRLDLHHVGAEAGQQLPRERAGDPGQVEDADAVEDAHQSRRKRSRTASSASSETDATRSESSRSVSTVLGPTSIRTE